MRWLFLIWLGAAAARASPLTLPTTSGASRSLADLRGRVAVLFYEDRHSRDHNEHVKRALRALLASDRALAARVVVVPVANLGGYDFWPARYFARRAVEKIARRHRLEIWLDWDRVLQRELGLRDEVANVAVLDPRGRMRFHRTGPLTEKEIRLLAERVTTLSTLAE
jgi:predicted transcriptional regulator